MTVELRTYQLESLKAIALTRAAGIGRQVIHLSTASGKTVIFAAMIAKAIEDDPAIRALILAFSTDLLGQARDKLKMIAPGLDIGLVDAFHKEFNSRCWMEKSVNFRKTERYI